MGGMAGIYFSCMPTLYYGDNLGVMREHMKDASVDLIYLTNANREFNLLCLLNTR